MFQTASTTTTTETETWCTTIIGNGSDPLSLSQTNQLMTELKHDFVIKEEEKEEKVRDRQIDIKKKEIKIVIIVSYSCSRNYILCRLINFFNIRNQP